MNSKTHNSSSQEVIRLRGMGNQLAEQLGLLGPGYLMASAYGVDMAKHHTTLAGITIADDQSLWWPELGVKMRKDKLRDVYAIESSSFGTPAIECDFDTVPAGLSFYFSDQVCGSDLFNDITSLYFDRSLTADSLLAKRVKKMPVFNSCPCCFDRAERIRNNIEQHPISQILFDLKDTNTEAEFRILTNYLNMVGQWAPHKLKFTDGQINAVGGNYTLRVNATMIHSLRVYADGKGKKASSCIRCYNSLGETMFVMSVSGSEYEAKWNAICRSADSDYSAVSSGAYLGK